MMTTAELAEREPEGDLPPGGLDATAERQLVQLADGALTSDPDRARDLLHGLVVLDRNNAAYWARLGRLEAAAGNLEDSRAAYRYALTLDDSDPTLALALAEAHANAGDAERATALLSWVTLERDLSPAQTETADRIAQMIEKGGAR